MTRKNGDDQVPLKRVLWLLCGTALAVSACAAARGLYASGAVPSSSGSSSSSSAPPAPAAGPAAAARAPGGGAPALPGDIARVKAASDASPGAYKASKDYALKIMQDYNARNVRKPPNAAWAQATAEAADRHNANMKTAELTVPLRSFDLMMVGTLYGYVGKLPEARAALAESLKLQPDYASTLEAALDLERDAKDIAGSEGLCKEARHDLDKRPKAAQEKDLPVLMQVCVKDHPSNERHELKAASFEQYVPWASPKDVKGERVYLATQECLGEAGTCTNRCVPTEPCNSRPLDVKWTKDCKHYYSVCREGCDEREQACLAKAKRL